MVIFKATSIGKVIDNDNVFKITGYTQRQIISFTGAAVRGSEKIISYTISGTYPNLLINILTDEFSIDRRFNFEYGIIYNQLFFLVDDNLKGNGIGTEVFYDQVCKTRDAGFIKIKIEASRTTGINGYYTWAVLGYTIINEDVDEFDELMQIHGLPYTNLAELIEGDKDFWKQYGFTFEGEFILDIHSANSKMLERYVNRPTGRK